MSIVGLLLAVPTESELYNAVTQFGSCPASAPPVWWPGAPTTATSETSK